MGRNDMILKECRKRVFCDKLTTNNIFCFVYVQEKKIKCWKLKRSTNLMLISAVVRLGKTSVGVERSARALQQQRDEDKE